MVANENVVHEALRTDVAVTSDVREANTENVLLETRICKRLDREDCLKCTPRRARDVGEGMPKMYSAREPGSM